MVTKEEAKTKIIESLEKARMLGYVAIRRVEGLDHIDYETFSLFKSETENKITKYAEGYPESHKEFPVLRIAEVEIIER